ncbi:hypothetical protein LTR85_011460 [Meristemomyces frigidus]|nr:hypothetical protein LTR85_011460 [Meristemomyces frigidus]
MDPSTHHGEWPATDPYSDDAAPAEAQAQPLEHSVAPHEEPEVMSSTTTVGQPGPTGHEAPASTVPTHGSTHTCAPPNGTVTSPQDGCLACGTYFAKMDLPPQYFRRKSSTFEDPRLPRWAREPGSGHDADTVQVGSIHDSTAADGHAGQSEPALHHRSSSLRRLLHFNHGSSVQEAVVTDSEPHHHHSVGEEMRLGLDQLKRRLSTKDMQVPHMHH